MTERTAMGDGRVSAEKLLAGGQAAAKQFITADFAQLAEATGSLISPALYGALAATGRLPFSRAQFEDTISRGGVGVGSSLKAFAAGFDAASQALVSPPAVATATPAMPVPPVGPELAALAARIRTRFAPATHATLTAGILRMADYQDVAYAARCLDLLSRSKTRCPPTRALAAELMDETARHLALWMSYEDTVRVADLKTRRSRFGRRGRRGQAQRRAAPGHQRVFAPAPRRNRRHPARGPGPLAAGHALGARLRGALHAQGPCGADQLDTRLPAALCGRGHAAHAAEIAAL